MEANVKKEIDKLIKLDNNAEKAKHDADQQFQTVCEALYCPTCKSRVVNFQSRTSQWAVWCCNCGCSTGFWGDKHEAVRRWVAMVNAIEALEEGTK